MSRDNGLVMMTAKSQSRATTSRTISISLTLHAHPLSGMKKGTCWLSTFHLQSAVQRAPTTVTLCTSPLRCNPATTCPGAALTPPLHTTGDPALHQQHASPFTEHGTAPVASGGATCWPKCLRWHLNGLHFKTEPHLSPLWEGTWVMQHMAGSDEFPHCSQGISEAFGVIGTSRSSLLD